MSGGGKDRGVTLRGMSEGGGDVRLPATCHSSVHSQTPEERMDTWAQDDFILSPMLCIVLNKQIQCVSLAKMGGGMGVCLPIVYGN